MGWPERALLKYRELKARRLARSIAEMERRGLGALIARALEEAQPPFLVDDGIFRDPSLVEIMRSGDYLEAAEEVVRHRFDILGSGKIDVSLEAQAFRDGDGFARDGEACMGLQDGRDARHSREKRGGADEKALGGEAESGSFEGKATAVSKAAGGEAGRGGSAVRGAESGIAPGTRRTARRATDGIGNIEEASGGMGTGRQAPEVRGEYRRIDWHRDFKSGARWDPTVPSTRVDTIKGDGSDVQVPWKLSRFHHLPVLGVAYRLTGDERYAREFRHQVEDWIEANPPLRGVNWTSPLEASIRAVNWIWCYRLLADSPTLDASFLAAFAASLFAHGRYIRSNLERPPRLLTLLRPLYHLLEGRLGYGTTDDVLRGLRTNHYLCDLVGLLYIGNQLSVCGEGRRWRGFAIRALARETKKQVYPDGAQYEGSLCYHRLSAEAILSATLLCLRLGVAFPAHYMERLEAMVEFTRCYTRPDGLAPQIGDNGDTRLHILQGYGARDPRDHRHLLAVGAALLARPDLAREAGGFRAEALLLGGAHVAAGGGRPDGEGGQGNSDSAPASRGFPHGGYYIMRAGGLYMMVDCVRDDPRAPASHRHNSRLSFELFAWDRALVVDPGVYVYTADAELRNSFRGTAYHNTVVVDGREQNELPQGNLFNMGRGADVRVWRWEVGEDRDFLDAEHYGYRRLASPVIHRRQILFLKRRGFWLVRDMLEGEGSHRFDLYLHLAPLPVEPVGGVPLALRTRATGTNLAIIPLREEESGLEMEIGEGWVAPSYGVREGAPVIRYGGEGEFPAAVTYALVPFRGEIDVGELAARAAQEAEGM